MRFFFLAAGSILALAVSGCSSQTTPAASAMTRAQAEQKLQAYAQDPHAPAVAQDAAQQEGAEDQAQQMLDKGH